jgi:hypothetical protein
LVVIGRAEHVKKYALDEVGDSWQDDAFPAVDQTVDARSQEIPNQAAFDCPVDISLGDKCKFADDDICGLQEFFELLPGVERLGPSVLSHAFQQCSARIWVIVALL